MTPSGGTPGAADALAVLNDWALAARHLHRDIEAGVETALLQRAGDLCRRHEERFRALALDPGRLDVRERRAFAVLLEETARWTRLASEAASEARAAAGLRAREAARIRRRLGFYAGGPTDEHSCNVSG